MRALGLLVPVALAVLVAATSASGTEPTCPDGEITLSAGVLSTSRPGGATDQITARGFGFVLPRGVAIEPGRESVSFVVEADHRLVYQADTLTFCLELEESGNARATLVGEIVPKDQALPRRVELWADQTGEPVAVGAVNDLAVTQRVFEDLRAVL